MSAPPRAPRPLPPPPGQTRPPAVMGAPTDDRTREAMPAIGSSSSSWGVALAGRPDSYTRVATSRPPRRAAVADRKRAVTLRPRRQDAGGTRALEASDRGEL